MLLKEIIKKFSKEKEHSENVSRLAGALFNKLLLNFSQIEQYNNERDLKLLEFGAKLHDIGLYFEKTYSTSHHKAGAKYIFENPPEDIDEKDKGVLAALIRYHRKSLPSPEHKIYGQLTDTEKTKVNYLASIIRLADALDYSHLNLIEDFKLEYDLNSKALTLYLPLNIMLSKGLLEAVKKKKDLFEKVFDVEIKIKQA